MCLLALGLLLFCLFLKDAQSPWSAVSYSIGNSNLCIKKSQTKVALCFTVFLLRIQLIKYMMEHISFFSLSLSSSSLCFLFFPPHNLPSSLTPPESLSFFLLLLPVLFLSASGFSSPSSSFFVHLFPLLSFASPYQCFWLCRYYKNLSAQEVDGWIQNTSLWSSLISSSVKPKRVISGSPFSNQPSDECPNCLFEINELLLTNDLKSNYKIEFPLMWNKQYV